MISKVGESVLRLCVSNCCFLRLSKQNINWKPFGSVASFLIPVIKPWPPGRWFVYAQILLLLEEEVVSVEGSLHVIWYMELEYTYSILFWSNELTLLLRELYATQMAWTSFLHPLYVSSECILGSKFGWYLYLNNFFYKLSDVHITQSFHVVKHYKVCKLSMQICKLTNTIFMCLPTIKSTKHSFHW